jgi:predicted AlkP superfamily pyrophosphatase or phosphodiesterase
MKRLLVPLLPLLVMLGGMPTSVGASPAPAGAQYVCLIVLDAGRPDYITRNLSAMPNLRALLQHARTYDRAWVGNLMSITPPDHAVIGTGSLPKDDGGIVNWDWGVHSTGKISPTMQAVANYQNGWAFKVIKDSGTPTLAGVIHTKYPHGLVIAGSGAHFHAAGPMGGPDANWIFSYERKNGYWAPFTLGPHPVPAALLNDRSLQARLTSSNNSTLPLVYDPLPLGQQDSLVMDAGIKALQLYRPHAILLNLAEPDTVGHWSLNWYPEIARLYRSFDADLGRLIAAYKQAGIYDRTLFVITADHGMVQSQSRVLDRDAVSTFVRNLLGAHSTILINGGGAGGPTMMPIWLKNPANNARTARAIYQHHFANVSAVYYMTQAGGHYAYQMAGCDSCSPDLQKTYDYLLSTEAGPTGEDIAILLRENTINSGLPRMRGRHGGADWGSQHITLIMSGPGVQSGVSHHPARLADIAPTIERFMGITPNARDGIVLADAFQQPNAADVTAQGQFDAAGTVYVNALMQRAAHDVVLERHGLLPSARLRAPRVMSPAPHLATFVGGAAGLLGAAIALAWVTAEVRRR